MPAGGTGAGSSVEKGSSRLDTVPDLSERPVVMAEWSVNTSASRDLSLGGVSSSLRTMASLSNTSSMLSASVPGQAGSGQGPGPGPGPGLGHIKVSHAGVLFNDSRLQLMSPADTDMRTSQSQVALGSPQERASVSSVQALSGRPNSAPTLPRAGEPALGLSVPPSTTKDVSPMLVGTCLAAMGEEYYQGGTGARESRDQEKRLTKTSEGQQHFEPWSRGRCSQDSSGSALGQGPPALATSLQMGLKQTRAKLAAPRLHEAKVMGFREHAARFGYSRAVAQANLPHSWTRRHPRAGAGVGADDAGGGDEDDEEEMFYQRQRLMHRAVAAAAGQGGLLPPAHGMLGVRFAFQDKWAETPKGDFEPLVGAGRVGHRIDSPPLSQQHPQGGWVRSSVLSRRQTSDYWRDKLSKYQSGYSCRSQGEH
ncbi:unnamed protein product [Discosporangium mesarthrocarpum]